MLDFLKQKLVLGVETYAKASKNIYTTSYE